MSTEDPGLVQCEQHGPQQPAFVCRHLNLVDRVGFVEGYDPDTPDEISFHAWCSECDAVLIAEGDWNDRSEAFAKPRLICRECYAAIRRLNSS